MVVVLQFVKRVAAIVLRFVFLIIVFVGLTYLDSSVTSVFDYLIYILFGALLLIGTYFNKQKAVLLIGLFLLMSAPLDIFGKGYFVDVIITNGIAVLLAISTLLLGLFQEPMRLSTLATLILLTLLQTLAMFAAAYYVGSGAVVVTMDHRTPLGLPAFSLGTLSPEAVFILLVSFAGNTLKELLVPHGFASLTVSLLMSLGIFHGLPRGMEVPPESLFLVWGLLTAVYVFREIYQVSYIDPLTELPSRRALLEEASKLTGGYVVAMADIDHFKKFNDKYGHDVGDDVLAFVASILRQNVRGSVFRYGGEEFTMLFRKGSLDEVIKHLDEVREKVANTKFRIRRRAAKNPSSAGEVTVTVSMGVAEYGNKYDSFSEVLKAADKALYRAKRKGRNRVSK